jgi:stage II sporulation protein D
MKGYTTIKMKQHLIIITVFAILLFATPTVFGERTRLEPPPAADNAAENTDDKTNAFPKQVSLLMSNTGEVLELSIEEYLIGCLFAQIDVNYHEEALKAQATAAHTYLLRLQHDGHVVSDNPATCQPYFTEKQAIEHFRGCEETYNRHLPKVIQAARHGANRAIFYNNEPIYAVYHSLSAGVTNTAYSVWGRDFPYLRSVDSSWDREHEEFYSVNEMSSETVRLSMFRFNRTATMPPDYNDWFTAPAINEFGYVISIGAGENRLSGGDMWRAFGLRSTAFNITHRNMGGDSVFVTETRGFGHGVGMSQHGANAMAQRGSDYKQILKHYYTEVTVVTINNE